MIADYFRFYNLTNQPPLHMAHYLSFLYGACLKKVTMMWCSLFVVSAALYKQHTVSASYKCRHV